YRRNVADEIEIELVEERCIDRRRHVDHEQRVAVGGRAYNGLAADVTGTARTVLDDELLAEMLRQPLPYQSGDDVGRASRPEWHDHAHRSRRISLRRSDARDRRQRGSSPAVDRIARPPSSTRPPRSGPRGSRLLSTPPSMRPPP